MVRVGHSGGHSMGDPERELAEAIDRNFTSPNVADSNMEPANIVDAIHETGRMVAKALDRLGNADAGTPMGGMEALGAVLKEAIEMAGTEVADGLRAVADAIRDSGRPKPG